MLIHQSDVPPLFLRRKLHRCVSSTSLRLTSADPCGLPRTGLTTCLSNTLLTWVQVGRNVGPWVNMVNSSFGIGSISAPLLFVMVERYVGNGLASYQE